MMSLFRIKNIYGDGQGPLASFVKTMAAINSYRDRGWFLSHKNADDLGMVYEIRKKHGKSHIGIYHNVSLFLHISGIVYGHLPL